MRGDFAGFYYSLILFLKFTLSLYKFFVYELLVNFV